MRRNIEPDRVFDHKPEPVKVKTPRYSWILPACALVVVVVLICTVGMVTAPVPVTERATDTLPIYTFESSETCATYTPETCPDCTWLSRFVGELDALAESPLEIKDVLHRAYVESRFDNQAVSATGDWGICQINAKTHPWVDTELLLTTPEYAAAICLDAYRAAYKACGKRWECCYRYGVKGCRDWKAGK